MLQFLIHIVSGILVGIVLWLPVISILIFLLTRRSGYTGWVGDLNVKGTFHVLLIFAVIHSFSIGLGNGISRTETATYGAVTGIVVTEILLAIGLMYAGFIPEMFQTWDGFVAVVKEQSLPFWILSAILLIPSALIGAGAIKATGFAGSFLGQPNF